MGQHSTRESSVYAKFRHNSVDRMARAIHQINTTSNGFGTRFNVELYRQFELQQPEEIHRNKNYEKIPCMANGTENGVE